MLYMAFKTANGLKVRLNHFFCEKYLDQKDIVAWHCYIEAFDSLRGFLSILGLIYFMLSNEDPILTVWMLIVMYLMGFFISQSYSVMSIYFFYTLIYGLYAFLSKYFLQYVAVLVIAIITKRYILMVSYIVARFISFLIVTIINFVRAKIILKKYGVYLGDVEITAIKLIKLFSPQKIKINQWIKEYSGFMKSI